MAKRKPCDANMFELLVLAALKHAEISEGRAVELLGKDRVSIRERMEKRVGRLDRKDLIDALEIMDSRGRHNPEGNSMMLWDREWEELRGILLAMIDGRQDVTEDDA